MVEGVLDQTNAAVFMDSLEIVVKAIIELGHVLQKFKIKCAKHSYLVLYAQKHFAVQQLAELGEIHVRVVLLNHIHAQEDTYLIQMLKNAKVID